MVHDQSSPSASSLSINVERSLKRFSIRFKRECVAFLACCVVESPADDYTRSISFVLLSILFLYFLQRKGFLDAQRGELNGDRHYLGQRFKLVQQRYGEGYFHIFYRSLLRRIFRLETEACPCLPELEDLYGNMPHLSQRLFDIDVLECKYHSISIPDRAFARLFRFLDKYEWLLNDGPVQSENVVTPDVLEGLFVQDASRKKNGAYYTREDITVYISTNSILPRLLDCIAEKCPELFVPDGIIWSLLRLDPERYMYAATRHGCALSLPLEIEAGINDPAQRAGWDESAPDAYGLPMETWREAIARRMHYAQLRAYLLGGSICSADTLITANLDLRQLMEDAIAHIERLDQLAAYYTSLEGLTILDPTCGSGAFLLTALTMLEPLYESCLMRMQSIVEERMSQDTSREDEREQGGMSKIRALLNEVVTYDNRRCFIRALIIEKNLYGVDIMREATEICKLRLFLKMLVPMQTTANSKALSSLDFNIRSGNALVGFASFHEVSQVLEHDRNKGVLTHELCRQMGLFWEEGEDSSAECCQQTERSVLAEQHTNSHKSSQPLTAQLQDLLNRHLAEQYGIEQQVLLTEEGERRLKRWREAAQPFHWIIEHKKIIQNGGFDVIIGNPPYVAYSQVKENYQVKHYETQNCRNLCAYVLERAVTLLREDGRCGMLVPISVVSSESHRPLIQLLRKKRLWISTYSNRPAKLLADVEQRHAILLLCNREVPILLSSAYRHWYEAERTHLFTTLRYTPVSIWRLTGMPVKSGNALAEAIFARLTQKRGFPLLYPRQAGATVWVHNGPTYWVRALPFEPNAARVIACSDHYRKLAVSSQYAALIVAAILNSSTFYFFYKLVSNCRDLGRRELYLFPLGTLQPAREAQLADLGAQLARCLKATVTRRTRCYSHRSEAYEVSYEEYYPALAREVLDEIDRVLAEHYGLTAEELDFLLHYDLKYRLATVPRQKP